MDDNNRPNHIEDALATMYTGQWFGWSDSKNKTYANLILHSKCYVDGVYKDNPHSKPTESEVNAKLTEMQNAFDDAKTKQTTDETSGKTKLKNLGLTDDEIKALTGK